VATYRLLAHIVRNTDLADAIEVWEQPWIRRLVDTRTGATLHARLPAAAVLVRGQFGVVRRQGVLLLPDFGTLPVASYRHVLRRLLELRD
jgi:hypothetical protein